MINRRNFLAKGIVLSSVPFIPVIQGATTVPSQPDQPVSYTKNQITPGAHTNYFISHRGVHLKQTVAGENSMESLILAKRVGFECIEFDVRFTKDKKMVVIHDETINRTLIRKDGKAIPKDTKVSDLTYQQIREEYLINTKNLKARSIVPNYEEYLQACATFKLIPFIEIKEPENFKQHLKEMIAPIERIIGKGNFVVTSNNKVNDILRASGDQHTMVMDILYQTTFERIANLQNAIMAISTSQFKIPEFIAHVQRAKSLGILTESHADTFSRFDTMFRYGVDYMSTDVLAPNPASRGVVIASVDLNSSLGDLKTADTYVNGVLSLNAQQTASLTVATQGAFVYGAYLSLKFQGKLTVNYGNQAFEMSSIGHQFHQYQLLMHNEDFVMNFTANENTQIDYLHFNIIRF
jgi:glycerophosphoryl diester phosphodiesterase